MAAEFFTDYKSPACCPTNSIEALKYDGKMLLYRHF